MKVSAFPSLEALKKFISTPATQQVAEETTNSNPVHPVTMAIAREDYGMTVGGLRTKAGKNQLYPSEKRRELSGLARRMEQAYGIVPAGGSVETEKATAGFDKTVPQTPATQPTDDLTTLLVGALVEMTQALTSIESRLPAKKRGPKGKKP